MNVLGVIPARYASTRLPFKMVRDLLGKPLLQWTWENASRARLLDKLIIACDDAKIEQAARAFGAEVVMTSSQHSSGTDRVAEAARDIDAQIVLNIQADEPLMHPSTIDALVQTMLDNKDAVMATVRKKLDDEGEILSPNVVKIICDNNDFALYFSRHPIPYYREKGVSRLYYKHLGLYAYTKDFLYTFKNLPVSYLEQAEKLEQLRALQAGYKIKVIDTEFDSWGVDTEEDLQKVERILSEKGIA
ncbi:MAG: 3-deoxy-manno-octulosonate cytidylyltransferase [Candidatus Omnitrophica bacterium]|nr:3-deoxy-manno-octulosonate cytidylyltransferase [Candidatus Omnitrophota bacterium]